MRETFVGVLICAALVMAPISGCTRSSSLEPIFVPTSNYASLDCDGVAQRYNEATQEALSNGKTRDNEQAGAVVAVAVIALLAGAVSGATGVPVYNTVRMPENHRLTRQVRLLKGEIIALETLAADKNCPLTQQIVAERKRAEEIKSEVLGPKGEKLRELLDPIESSSIDMNSAQSGPGHREHLRKR